MTIIAVEIVEDLEAALEQFRLIAEDLAAAPSPQGSTTPPTANKRQP